MLLPDRLNSGDRLQTAAGQIVSVVRTRRRDEYGEPIVRLRYPSGVTGNQDWTRDMLQSAGCELAEKEIAKDS